MKISAFGRAVALGFLYIALFVLLVVVQFPSAGPIGAVAGGVSIKGLPSADGKGLRSAEITAAGMRLVFSERYPLILVDAAGKERSTIPTSFTTQPSGFTVLFADGSRLRISADSESRASWTLVPAKSVQQAVIRYELAYGAALLAPAEDGSPRVSLGGATYRMSGVTAQASSRRLTISASKGALPPFVASREVENKQSGSVQFIAQAPLDPAVWSKEISDWSDKAWNGLSGPAFDATAGTWAATTGSPGTFDEDSFIAFEAEAMRRGRTESAAALVGVVRASATAATTWKSVPFAGRSAVSMAAYEEANLADVKSADRLVQSRSIELFYRPGIIPFLFDRAPYSLAQEAFSLARTLDFSRSDPVQSIRIIEAYLDARNYVGDDENPFSRATDLVDKALTPAIRKADGKFYLQSAPDGTCDALVGLAAGNALMRLADATGKSIYAGIGQSLILGFAKLADDSGSVPARVAVSNGVLTKSDERLKAAVVYPFIVDSPYYPHAVSFYKQIGPGAWAWTCASAFAVASSPDQTTFTVTYPEGSSHYVALYGVKQFARIQLYGLNYNMDAAFENYNASGYFYKKPAGALYLKMRHKSEDEQIRLFY
ncbi:MAG TPA: hypothetical protein VMX33_12240 [bacterium]|nr:hypothetical protein [bacterium]